MNKDKHIPQGYKDSPLGIIPKEWEVKRLGDLCYNQGDYGLNAPATDYSMDLPTYLRITDIDDNGKFIHVDKKSVDSISAEKYYLKNGDIVFARTGATVGKTYLYDERDGKLVYAGFLIKFSPNPTKLLSYYLKVYTETQNYKNWVSVTSQRSGQPGINATEYCSFKIATPPIKEQKQICSILQFWDTAIEKQSELIEKLTLRKRALMQQLLTGKKRLPGFRGEWKEVKLGDVSNFLRNNTLSREQLNDDDGVINNIHYGDVLIKYPSIIDCRKEKLQYINDGISILTDYVENGDIIMSDTAEDETVGRVCEVQNVGNKKILAGLHTMLIRPHDKLFAPYFLGYYLNSEVYHKQLIPLIQGIKVCSIGKVAVQNTFLTIPFLEEQRIIASVLVKADKEIELANEKLASLQSQKRGLMQQLLTGKKRIMQL